MSNTESARPILEVTETELAAAFTEWDRRYREDPAGFQSDMERIMAGQTVEDYGTAAAAYLLTILEAQQ